jgi:hypothetical protein
LGGHYTVIPVDPIPEDREQRASSENLSRFATATTEQTTANQQRELREIAARMGCEIGRNSTSKWHVLLAFRQHYFEGFFPTPWLGLALRIGTTAEHGTLEQINGSK